MLIQSVPSCTRLSTIWRWMQPELLVLACMIPVAVSLASKSSNSTTYIVHTSLSEMPSVFQNPKSWYISTLASVSSDMAPELDHRDLIYSYEAVTHGFAIRLTAEQIPLLEKVPGFLSVVPDSVLQLQTTYTSEFMGLVSAAGQWMSANSGEDVIVGVIDTGVWPESLSFSDEGLGPVPARWKGTCETAEDFQPSKCCNKKLIGARAFSGPDTFTTEQYRNSPRDVLGHGTHTASTIAGAPVPNASFFGYAAGTARGISPSSRIAVYKACWSSFGSGVCMTSDVLKALDQAVADGVDVVSLSLGGPPQPFYNDPVAIGTFGALQKGVIVSFAAGNDGPESGSVINVAPWQVTVAASTVDREFPSMVRLGNGATYVGTSLSEGEGLDGKQVPLIYSGDADESCLEGKLQEKKVRGKIIVCGVAEGAATAVRIAGAAGIIAVQSADYGVELPAKRFPLPGAVVAHADGMAIKKYASVKAALRGVDAPSAALFFNGTTFRQRCAPVVTGFSGRGPSSIAQDILKPDVAAPGLNILASWSAASSATPDAIRDFNIVSGTSMSCPHVTGVAALLRAAHPQWSPSAVKSALMTSALTCDRCNQPIHDTVTSSPATPFHFGSGQVNPQAAFHPGLVYDLSVQDYVDYLCRLNYSRKQLLLFTKGQYSCTPQSPSSDQYSAAAQLNYPAISIVFRAYPDRHPGATRAPLLSTRATRTATNVGNTGAFYTANVVEPAGTKVKVVPATLAFHETGEKLSFDVIITSTRTRRKSKQSESHAFGSLSWINRDGGGEVRAPLVVTWAYQPE